jgi:chromosome partitioning protein
MKVFTLASVKGGCGKSTGAIFLAQAFALKGKKVVAIDADPNNNLTDFFLRDIDPAAIAARSLYDAIMGKRKLAACIFETTDGVDVVPAVPAMARLTAELAGNPAATLRFPKAVQSLDADIVIIDSAPGFSVETSLALYAADVILVPVSMNRWTLAAFQVLEHEAATIGETFGRTPELIALPSMVSPREADDLRILAGWNMTKTAIPKSAAIRNAGNAGRPLKEGSVAWNIFDTLAGELL